MTLFLTIAVVVVLAVIVAPARAVPRGETTYRVDTLRSDFVLPTKLDGTYRYLVANIYRRTNVHTGESGVSAVAGRGTCYLSGGATACEADLQHYRVIRFDADPAFATAKVVLKRGRQRHHLSFTTSTPYVYIPPASQEPTHTCDGGSITKIYLTAKNARAEGRLFGHKVSTGSEAPGYGESENLEQTLEIEDCP